MSQQRNLPDDPTPIICVNLSASRNPDGETFVIGGLTDDETQWSETLTLRAARALWHDLTRLLFPEKSDQVIAQVTTIPTLPPLNAGPSPLTAWVFVTGKADGSCVLAGWNGYPGWRVQLSATEVYRFWASLDTALFPAGW